MYRISQPLLGLY